MRLAIRSANVRLPTPIGMLTWIAVLGCGGIASAATNAPNATVRTDHGLHTVSYNTLHGTVRVYLPDDMAPGDTISGTVALEPAGRTDAERAANGAVLRGVVIDDGSQKASAGSPSLRLKVADAAKQALPLTFTVAAATRRRATASVPLASPDTAKNESARIAGTPGTFQWPPVIQQGAPVTLTGPFDGDLGTTHLSIGGNNAQLLAESPRQAVFQTPGNGPVGPTPIEVRERDTTASGTARSVQVELSAPKTDLRSGERTEVSIAIAGLQGLNHPLPVELRTSGTVTAAGGNLQQIEIQPGDPGIDPGGVFHTARTLTGLAPGGFEFTAEVVWPHPAQHWLVGKTVHVEAGPIGFKGRWRVPVILLGGTEKHGVYFGGDKAPNLQYCNWIRIGGAKERDGVDYVTVFQRVPDPTKPKTEPKPPPKPGDTKPVDPVPPVPAPGAGSGTGETTKPPPCKEGTMRVVGSEKLEKTLLDGKQEMFLQVYTDKDGAAAAAKGLSEYLKKIAELGGKASEDLPEGDGPGGAVVDFLLKYLDMGSTVIDETLAGRIKLGGATEFTAAMNVGLRDVVATCATLEICRLGVWVTEKKFTQTETKRREIFSKKAKLGDDDWTAISDASGHTIDPAKAAKWANDFFKEQANILKGNYDELKKFKDACK